jgi:hypothetical protein
MWSQRLAEEIARTLGYSEGGLDGLRESNDQGQRREAICLVFDEIVGELAEAFRHLPPDKIQWTRDFASFLRGQLAPHGIGPAPGNWLIDKLREVRDFALFLRGRYGYEQPVDESAEWTEEDERDATLASLRRLEEDDPDPWEEPDDAQPR